MSGKGGFLYASVASLILVFAAASVASEESCPESIGELSLPGGWVGGIAVQVPYGYVGGSWGQLPARGILRVVDFSTLTAPVEVGSLVLPSRIRHVAVAGQYAYLVEDGVDGDPDGLRIVDVTDPSVPVEVGFCDTPYRAMEVAVSDGVAYVAAAAGLYSIDVSDPTNPTEMAVLGTEGWATGIAYSSGHVYITDEVGGLGIVDVTNPSAPVEVGRYCCHDIPAEDVAVSAGLAYVGYAGGMSGQGAIRIIDIADPQRPLEIGGIRTDPYAIGDVELAGVSDSYLLAGGGWASPWGWGGESALTIVDVRDRTNPIRLGKLQGVSRSAPIARGHALVGRDGWLRVLDLSTGCLGAKWIDIVAHTPGKFGSWWKTDVVVNGNPYGPSDVQFILHTADGEFAMDGVVTGPQGVFEDVVGLLGYEGKGALEIRGDYLWDVSARTYNEAGNGTFGQYQPGFDKHVAHRTPDFQGFLFGLRQREGEYRTNLAIANFGGQQVEVLVTLYATDGTFLAEYSLPIEYGEVVHDLEPFKNRAGQPNLGWGYAELHLVGWWGIVASASVIDSRTNDAITVPLTIGHR